MDDVEAIVAAAARALALEAPVFTRLRVDGLIEDRGDPDAWFREWVDRVEPTLVDPTMVWGYPAWQAALARIVNGLADRFEVYLGGLELGNAFAEELDADELRGRFERTRAARLAAGRPPHPVDERFLAAVDRMPRCAGIAIGLDRLVMALTGARDIAEVQVR